MKLNWLKSNKSNESTPEPVQSKFSEFESLKDINRVSYKEAYQTIKKMTSGGWGGQNALLLGESNVVYMMPHNNGMPTCPFVWYQKNGKFVEIMDNQDDFTQIANLNNILHKVTDVARESYEKKEPISSFSNFGIKLVDEIKPKYSGNGELLLINGDFVSPKGKADPNGSTIYFTNEFLDKFIGWNFGDVVRDDKELEEKLLDFNNQLIKDGTRLKKHPTGFEVTYRDHDVDNFYRFNKK